MSKRLIVLAGAVLAAAVSVTVVLAAGVIPTLLARGTLTTPVNANADGIVLRTGHNTDHAVQTITLPPGSSSGWHKHPGVVLVTVKSGTAVHYDSNCKPEPIGTGQAFWESGPHAGLLRNETGHDAVIYVTYILPTGAPLRTDLPNPGCSVE